MSQIFNIVEELEKERKKNKELEEEIEDLKEQVEYQDIWRKEYSNRIDLAIEYIEKNSLYDEMVDYDYEENPYISYTTDEYVKDRLLNILQGSDNNE